MYGAPSVVNYVGSDHIVASYPERISASTLIVTPTFNERENLGELVERFFRLDSGIDLLVVDDESPDGTADLCAELMARYPRLHLLSRSGRRGLGRAYVEGIQFGLDREYEFIGTMDADLSHLPEYLPVMIDTLQKGADVVIGSRYVRDGGTINWRIRRILLSWWANSFAAFILRIPAHDVTSGFRLYRGRVLARLGLDSVRSTGYSFLVELLYRAHLTGSRIAETPIIFYDREMGKSKLRSREIYLGAARLVSLWLAPPDLHDDASS